MMNEIARAEIMAVIFFYEKHGRDWLLIVAFLSAKATGHWPPPEHRR